MKLNFDVVIVGAGVAGMSAAIYLKRANKSCCLIERGAPGGQITKTSTVENYPGFFKITGPDLAIQMYDQVQNLGIPYQYGEVSEIIDHQDYKIVKTADKDLTCKAVILAMGRSPRKLNLPLEEKLSGRGISWCAICDGPLYKGKNVLVVGGGNSALEEALYLSSICKKVTLIHRKDQFTAQQYLVDQVNQRKNIKVMFSTEVEKFLETDEKLSGVVLKQNQTDKTKKLKVDGCFLYIGSIPNTDAFKNLGILDEAGYIQVDATMRTEKPMIYAAGDVIKKELYQIVTATSDGAIAATSCIKDLESTR